ncbi:MAG: hypothetical protein KA104_00590 [Candidatus Pacebacteria bacterium]|nr:hypothetical protein [Candidatus Paceibacterota bacterium]
METPAVAPSASKTSPKDFFLWLGAIVALYGSITSFIALLFQYINYAFPDKLAFYGDPYGGAVRFSMAALIVMVPTLVVIFRLIRASIEKEPGKAHIWVRRWAIVLTLFIATITILIDLITLINTFLGGEITTRFGLKVAVVLLVALGVFLHFLADQKGYWILNPKKANLVGIAVAILTLVSIVSGFFIIGTPSHVRMLRYDEQKVQNLTEMQYQIVNYWQLKRALPTDTSKLNDSLTNYSVPVDPQSETPYVYKVESPVSFTLCATFNKPTPDMAGKGEYAARSASYPAMGGGVDENWQHGAGNVCFTRTIDPERYPAIPSPVTKGL